MNMQLSNRKNDTECSKTLYSPPIIEVMVIESDRIMNSSVIGPNESDVDNFWI